MADKHRVLIVDDHPVLRRGLAMLINDEPDLEVCGEADDVAGGLEACDRLKPDIAVVDISLRESDGVDLMKQVSSRGSGIPILAVSMHEEAVYAERALRAGARGYITKRAAEEKITEAIRHVLDGGIYLSGTATERIMKQLVGAGDKDLPSPAEKLSDREFQVLRLIGRGLRTGRIAETMHVSVKTVETYQAHIKEKLGLESADELSEYAVAWSKANLED
jgi:DNA-binding NarL/FixJ family response regulator